MENLTGGTPPVRYLPCVVPCKLYFTSIETTPHFRVNVYGFASNLFQAKIILNAVASEAIDCGNFSLANIKANPDEKYTYFDRMGYEAETYCQYSNNAVLPSWSTTYTLEEVEPLFRFPTLYDGETIEIPKETSPEIFDNGLYIGKDENKYPVFFPLDDLPRHAFFTGTPGSGKTNTMLHMATELKRKNIPFLVLEPAKKEYRELLGYPEMQDICLFSPHLQSHFPLQMNPFEFPKGVRLNDHINSLLEVFKGSFSLEGPTYRFLSNSICKSYEKLGWALEDVNEIGLNRGFPTLQSIYDNLEEEINASSYDGELKGNLRSFLQVRLGGLMERDAGELYNTPYSTVDPGQWLYKTAIVELEVLEEQAKNFFVLLICHYIFESLRVDPQGGRDDNGEKVPVRHVVFIEEAHNIIAPDTQQASSDSVDPKISATAYIVKMLAEVRALREGIVIADQLPTALATEVTKNTCLKLVHRLTAKDDREQIGQSISASEIQLEQIASFSKGKALIYHEKVKKPFVVQVAEWKKPHILYDFSNDEELFFVMKNKEQVQHAIRCAFYSWKYKCFDEFANVRSIKFLENFQIYIEENVDKREKEKILSECDMILRKAERMKKLWFSVDVDNDTVDELQKIIDYCNEMKNCIETICRI